MLGFTSLVIVDDLDTLRSAFSPGKTDSPLIVDSDTVLPLPVADQSLKPISGNRPDVFQFLGVVEHSQFPPCSLCDVAELPAAPAMKQLLGFLAAEGADHSGSISRSPLAEWHYTSAGLNSPTFTGMNKPSCLCVCSLYLQSGIYHPALYAM
jgi:hypothetical protein